MSAANEVEVFLIKSQVRAVARGGRESMVREVRSGNLQPAWTYL